MKKSLILLAGLAIGTAAIAQDAAPTQPGGPESSAQAPADSTDVATSSGVTPTADTSNYPRCSAGVTDKCVQREGRAVHRRR